MRGVKAIVSKEVKTDSRYQYGSSATQIVTSEITSPCGLFATMNCARNVAPVGNANAWYMSNHGILSYGKEILQDYWCFLLILLEDEFKVSSLLH